MDTPLSPAEQERLVKILGRRIPLGLLGNPFLRLELTVADAEAKVAKRYERRVWSVRSRHEYLVEQVIHCAERAMSVAEGTATSRDVHLPNPHGQRFPPLGMINFRIAELIPVGEVKRHCPAIERIELHPSLRRQGFLSALREEVGRRGARYLVLQSVFNSGLAYHLYQRALQTSDVVLLTPDRVNFEENVSPGPTFAWRV